MSDFNWSEKYDLTLADGSVVTIDKPINHDASVYANPKLHDDETEYDEECGGDTNLSNPMSALRSLVQQNSDEEGMPTYTAQFLIPFNSVQEIAYGLFVVKYTPKIISTTSEGVLVECEVSPVCSTDNQSPLTVMHEYGLPMLCWFEREVASGRLSKDDLDLPEKDSEVDELEHYCEGQISEFAVAVHAVEEDGIDDLKVGRGWEVLCEAIYESDENLARGYYDDSFVGRFTDAGGKEWRVVGAGHND